MTMMQWIVPAMVAVAALATPTAQAGTPTAQAGTPTAQGVSAKPLFADETPLHIVIRGPIAGLANSNVPLDAALAVMGSAPETLPIQISARGITRRKHEICSFPPIKVGFAAKPGPTSLFAKQKELKLVTHCQPQGGQQFELLELAAYRIYEVLTPVSFKTRLATVDYVGPSGQPITTRPGFFIEDFRDMARRNGLTEFKTTEHVPPARINPHDAVRYALFEVMIGNLDWAMNAGPAGKQCCHNSRLLGVPDTPGTPGTSGKGGLVPVPRDFDLAGMVDAPYAGPPDGIDVENVRERRYRGYCRTSAQEQTVATEMLSQRAAILGVLDGIPGLDDKQRRKAQAYLAGFFERISTPSGLSRLTATCIGAKI